MVVSLFHLAVLVGILVLLHLTLFLECSERLSHSGWSSSWSTSVAVVGVSSLLAKSSSMK